MGMMRPTGEPLLPEKGSLLNQLYLLSLWLFALLELLVAQR